MKNKRLYLVRNSYDYYLYNRIPTLVLNNDGKWDTYHYKSISSFCSYGINRWARSLKMKVGEYRVLEISETKPTKNIPYWILMKDETRSITYIFTRTYISVFTNFRLWKIEDIPDTCYAYEV